MMIELTFLKDLILIKQAYQKNVIFLMIGIFFDKGFKLEPFVCNGCCNVLMMSVNLNDTAILNKNGADYHNIINGIIKGDALNLPKKK